MLEKQLSVALARLEALDAVYEHIAADRIVELQNTHGLGDIAVVQAQPAKAVFVLKVLSELLLDVARIGDSRAFDDCLCLLPAQLLDLDAAVHICRSSPVLRIPGDYRLLQDLLVAALAERMRLSFPVL